MNPSNKRSDRVKWLMELQEGIPKEASNVSKRTLEIWSRYLVRFSLETLEATANILIEREVFFPSLAEILAVCRESAKRGDGREWKQRIEGWKAEALPKGEAVELLAEVNKRAGTSMESTSGGMIRLVRTPPDQVVGAGLSDEEWAEIKAKMKAVASGE